MYVYSRRWKRVNPLITSMQRLASLWQLLSRLGLMRLDMLRSLIKTAPSLFIYPHGLFLTSCAFNFMNWLWNNRAYIYMLLSIVEKTMKITALWFERLTHLYRDAKIPFFSYDLECIWSSRLMATFGSRVRIYFVIPNRKGSMALFYCATLDRV